MRVRRICGTPVGLSSRTARPQTSVVGHAVRSIQRRIPRRDSDARVGQTTRARHIRLPLVSRGVFQRTVRAVRQRAQTASRNGVRRRQQPRTARRRAVRVDQVRASQQCIHSVQQPSSSVASSSFEVVDRRHNLLCQLLSLDLRQDLAEVFRRHVVEGSHIWITYRSLKKIQPSVSISTFTHIFNKFSHCSKIFD